MAKNLLRFLTSLGRRELMIACTLSGSGRTPSGVVEMPRNFTCRWRNLHIYTSRTGSWSTKRWKMYLSCAKCSDSVEDSARTSDKQTKQKLKIRSRDRMKGLHGITQAKSHLGELNQPEKCAIFECCWSSLNLLRDSLREVVRYISDLCCMHNSSL